MKYQIKKQIRSHSTVLAILIGSIILATGYYAKVHGSRISSAAAQQPDPFAPCTPAAANEIACENSKTGNQPTQWDISGSGSDSIQGFATDISVNRGETVHFKIDTPANDYRLEIYRLGYYGGAGARLIATVQPSAALPQDQPPCAIEQSTGLYDCGNWAESASWAVPANATSGIYIAKLVREDVSGSSHIVFIVRNDGGNSDLLFQTSDTTWQAYNEYGGNSLYVGSPAGRAYKVSYNRPFITRDGSTQHDWLFTNEVAMVRWIEANGYNVSYFSGVDTDRRGGELLNHKAFLSVGHDEYWSAAQRTSVETARNAGVHLAFFSGNIMFWKTRWENSIAGPSTPYRTLVCYKDTHADAKIDPLPNVWTGTWRDPRFSPPNDGGRPENAVLGTIFTVNGPAEDSIRVPEALGKYRFWRGISGVANQTTGSTATVGSRIVGYEWDEDLDNGFRPSGLIRLSVNTVDVPSYLLDYGSTYGYGTATHSLTLYRHSSGALVFSAATVRWSWGLDNRHDQSDASTIPAPDTRIRQATVNLFADMGVQPATLQAGLTAATQSADTQPPIATITFPAAGAILRAGTSISITGTASDAGGGVVAGVNLSVDGGNTWHRTNGSPSSWNYNWTPAGNGPVTIMARAVDDSANAQTTPTETAVTVGTGQPNVCPCNIFGGIIPTNTSENDGTAVELGLKFRADSNGSITGVRFYKGSSQNGGTHTGHLWSSTGQSLGTATFTGETASGWQEASFPNPIAITANTTYVISYYAPQGHYAADTGYFTGAGVDNSPLHALSDAQGGGNGVYRYGAESGYPNDTYAATNYWVDVVFSPAGAGPDTTPPAVTAVTPAGGSNNVNAGVNLTAAFSEAVDAATVSGATIELRDAANALVPATVTYNEAAFTATLDPTASLAAGASYTARVRGGSTGVKDLAGNSLVNDLTWSFTTAAPPPPGATYSIWSPTAVPSVPDENDGDAVELGLKFRADFDGLITGVRFYKGSSQNGGTHTGHLWSSTGQSLGTATFTGETASGWQEASFPNPIAITANTTYVISYYAPQGHYAADTGYFTGAGVDNSPLHALSDTQGGGNGVYRYRYGAESGYPSDAYAATNYWVDVVFSPASPAGTAPDTTPPAVNSVTPAVDASNMNTAVVVTATFSEAVDAATVSGATIELRDAANALVPATVTYNAGSLTATLAPTAPLAGGLSYTARVRGGSNGIKDLAGNAMVKDLIWSFTTAAAALPGATYSIWSPTTIPGNTNENDGLAVELGLKFRADFDGLITGVRFYKGSSQNGGTHTGHLWSGSGQLLGTATFTGETASGWQEASFPNPIAITANTTYVISYFAPLGHYAFDENYFNSGGVDSGPLHALSRTQAGGNGVFRYGSQSGFPNDTYISANYWVDVVFADVGPIPPQVASVTPAPAATGVSIGAAPAAVFSEGLDPASVNTATVLVRDAANNQVPVNVSYAANTISITPVQAFGFGQTYTVTLKGGSNTPNITDGTGTPLASDYSWSFTTSPLFPILVITGAGNKFTQYYGEILRAEGFNNFNTLDVTQLSSAILANYDVVILGEVPLSAAQATLLGDWVTAGGNLIAMRPDKQLAALLGISDAAGTLPDAYLLVDTAREPGAGIVNQTIQYHSTADRYTLAGATQVATLYESVSQATTNPAVTIRMVGTGQAAAFTFDLARSIVYTRQGNPLWAGQERDGADPLVIRPNDLFYPNYVNLNKVAIPQADELQRLFANMILFMNQNKRPLARFWYLPNKKKAVILMTGDDHATDSGTRDTFNNLIAASAPGCSVADWECYRATSWIYTVTSISNAQALNYTNQGFELGVHVSTNCADWAPAELESFFANDIADFAAKYTSIPLAKTNRTHCLAWSDWATTPKVELNHGIRLDETYYYWPPEWVQNRPGFMTGSGFPMRFADLDGTIIDVYQANTHLVNENGLDYPEAINAMLDRALGPEGYYGVFGTHYDYRANDIDSLLLDSARQRNVSLITAQQLLTWLDGRNSSSFGNPSWNGTALSFTITVGAGANNLYAMLPNQAAGGNLSSLSIDGAPVTFTVETIKGRSYAMFRAATGNVVATYGQ